VNQSNLILPAGDVKMGPFDYYVYSNSLVDEAEDLNDLPIKTVGNRRGSRWEMWESGRRQSDSVQRGAGGRPAVVLHPHHEAGWRHQHHRRGQRNVRDMIGHLIDIPKQMTASLVFDQSVFVKEAIKTLLHEGLIGLLLTSLMILLFLGSLRATSAVFLSIPLSALATFVVLYMMDSTVNTMILGGLALAFSRIIDNSVISLENIYRHLEGGALPAVAAEVGAMRSAWRCWRQR
jgi:HAE1 family hydrophobic/amphiphilic exporter-1